MKLKTLTNLRAELAAIRAEQSKASSALGDIAAEEFDLLNDQGTKIARVTAAENHLIDQLARRDLGEPCDVPAAEKALIEAKALPDDGFERAARLRVLDTLKQRHEAKHAECHEKGVALMAAIRAAEIEALNDMANDLRNDAKAAMEATARAEALLNAVRTELNERGASYTLPPLNEQAVILACQPTQTEARAEVTAALAA